MEDKTFILYPLLKQHWEFISLGVMSAKRGGSVADTLARKLLSEADFYLKLPSLEMQDESETMQTRALGIIDMKVFVNTDASVELEYDTLYSTLHCSAFSTSEPAGDFADNVIIRTMRENAAAVWGLFLDR